MDAQGGAAVSAEQGGQNYSSNASRRGRGRDGGGYRHSGSSQKWIPSETGSSSSAAGRLDTTGESSSSATNNGALSGSHSGVTSSSNNRASAKVHNSDLRPNIDQGRASKGSNSSGSRVGAIQGRGESGDIGRTVAIEHSFVPYLPQDDAVVAGLGEREGGVDASETQEVTDLLNEQLSALLCLPPRQFWKKVAADESLSVFLDSYLHFRRRWFDNALGSAGEPNLSVVAGDGDLSRRAFMVLLRMSSNHDPGTPASESLSAKEHAAILLYSKLLDIPKLMDISAIYGHDNAVLTKRLVSNVFKAQPSYAGELAAYVPPLLERIITMHQRCYATIEAITHPSEIGTAARGVTHVRGELLEVVDFLSDVMITLKAFVNAYPQAAKILVSSGNPSSGQGLFLPALATVHDTLLPMLGEGFAILSGSADGQQSDANEMDGQPKEVGIAARDRLHKLSERLVDLAWKLLELPYLAEISVDDLTTAGAVSNKSYEDAIWKGDSLVQAIVALAMGPSDSDDDIAGELGSSVTRLICTGALLQRLERSYGLSYRILQARQRGAVVLDEAQQDYLSALVSDNKSPDRGNDPLLMTTESFPQLTLPESEVEDETAIQQSKISQVKDIFSDYGDGFIAACLEAYDNDPEKVIERVLEGTLHSDLLLLDTSLTTKPNKLVQAVKDKGKGKVSEQEVSDKGKSIWEEKRSAKESGSSSSLANNLGASGQHFDGSSQGDPITVPANNAGRYVRRQKSDGTFSELLDSRNDNMELRAAIKAAAAQIEYEDEYDDSFDELGGYAADAGGNEETESLADQVARRGVARDENVGLRSSSTGRPVILTPWGSSTGKGSGHSAGAPRANFQPQKSAPVVPVGEGQSPDTQPGFAAGQAQGGRGGRGRKKWKEQGPKPQFYLKDGKLYSYKVAGAVGVSNVEEAEAIKQGEEQTLFGLGAGGNVPVQQQENSASGRKIDGTEEDSRPGRGQILREGGRPNPATFGEGGRGRGASSRGRGAPGQGSYVKRDENRYRKDQAMKKHFGGLGGM